MRHRGEALCPGLRVVFCAAATLFCTATASAQVVGYEPAETWKKIAPSFQPPAELAKDLGNYRSPLVLDDGRAVQTPQEWRRRRQEILRFWQKALGPWPPLLERPAIEVLQSRDREGFTQKKVRLMGAPRLQIDGYLLVPRGHDQPRWPQPHREVQRAVVPVLRALPEAGPHEAMIRRPARGRRVQEA